MKNLLFFLALLFGFLVKTVTAGTIVLDAIDSGYYDRNGFHWASIKSYEAYSCGQKGFLVFNLPSTSNVISAKLRLSTGSVSNVGVAGISRVDPSISIDRLRATQNSSIPRDERVAIYKGLTTGELGRANPSSAEIDVPLNSAGINMLNTSSGQIAISTYIIHATTGVCGKVFGGTGEHSTRQLILETEDAPTPTVTVISPNVSATYHPGNEITLEWTTTDASASDTMVLSMKRDAAAGDSVPDGENWIRFTENTPNDGSEIITIPEGLTQANDWHFFVRHSVSDVFDASDEPFTYEIPVTPQYTLNATKTGAGSGAVSSDPIGIDCGADCTEGYDDGALVTLTAVADTGSVFTGWSHPDCSGTDSCQVTMDADKDVTANFDAVVQQVALTVTKSGNGTGTVTSSPEHGINCGDNCQASYPADPIQTVSLQVEADPGFVFNGWSGACSDTSPVCDVIMDGDKTVSAQFIAAPVYGLTVGIEPAGSGSVSDGSQINCPETSCTGNYADGLEITLTAEETNSDYQFSEWQGCPAVTSNRLQCTVAMNDAKNVTAAFELTTPPPTVEKIIFNLTTEPTNFLHVKFTCKTKDEDLIDSYTWDFGDGSPAGNSSEKTIEHTYNQEGTYNVSCTAIDSFDGSGSLTSELLLLDSDGDSLPDLWEMNGIDINDDEKVDLDLPAMGANSQHKDIFVEIDYMDCNEGGCDPGDKHSHRPRDEDMQAVINAFDQAPVPNPDENGGIKLHLDVTEPLRHVNGINFPDPVAGEANDYWDFKNGNPPNPCGVHFNRGHFGTKDERGSDNCNNILDARKLVFRYAIYVHRIGQTTIPGIAEGGLLMVYVLLETIL